jgi:hypothetical protein
MLKIIWRGILLITLLCLIFFSKWSDYKNNVEFYKKEANISIKKIVETRGTKVYYNSEDFFYLETYKGDKLEVGDSISKKNEKIEIFTNGTLTGYGQIKKPKENYFLYFFGW